MPINVLNAVVFPHLPFEDLSSLEFDLLARGFATECVPALFSPVAQFWRLWSDYIL